MLIKTPPCMFDHFYVSALHLMLALERAMSTNSEVVGLAAVMGLKVETFAVMSEEHKTVADKISNMIQKHQTR